MKRSKHKRKSSYYSYIFLAFTFSIVTTILLLSAILYFNFDTIETHQTYTYTMDNLQQISKGSVLMKINTSTLAKQIFIDKHISKLRNYSAVDLMDQGTAFEQMQYYRAASPFIESIYIYNTKTGLFYISSEFGENSVQSKKTFYDRGLLDIVDHYKNYTNLTPIPRLIKTAKGDTSVYTFMLQDGIGSNPPGSIIFVNYSEKYLYKDISDMADHSSNGIFTIDGKGMVVSDSWKYPMLDKVSQLDYIKRIMADPSAGYFITEVNGEKSFVAYSTPDLLGWRYIRLVPYGEITGNIARMRVFTAIAVAVILILGLAVSYLISRRLSTSVEKKLSKLNLLEIENRSSLNLYKAEYLKKLLLGEEQQDPEHIGEQFRKLGIPMDRNGWFSIVLLRIDQYGEFTRKYEGSDRGLLKFAIMNIAQEILSAHYQVMAVDMNADLIAVFLNLPADAPASSVQLPESRIREAQDLILKHFDISVSVTLSTPVVTAEGLGRLYRQVAEASFYRMFYGYRCIIHTAAIAELEAEQYEYPVKKEKLLVNEFVLGRIEESVHLLKEIIADTANYSYAAFNIAVVHLAYAVGNAVGAIRKDCSSNGELNMNSIFHSLTQVEVVEDVYKQFADLFEATLPILEEKKNSKYDELVAKTLQLINREYMNPNLSLESIADVMGMSSSYIGRLFKKNTTKTILDYITEIRMQSARRLLTETDYSIGEIAEQTGFTNSPYFYKAFKKTHAITPAEYRKSEKALKHSYGQFEKSDMQPDSI